MSAIVLKPRVLADIRARFARSAGTATRHGQVLRTEISRRSARSPQESRSARRLLTDDWREASRADWAVIMRAFQKYIFPGLLAVGLPMCAAPPVDPIFDLADPSERGDSLAHPTELDLSVAPGETKSGEIRLVFVGERLSARLSQRFISYTIDVDRPRSVALGLRSSLGPLPLMARHLRGRNASEYRTAANSDGVQSFVAPIHVEPGDRLIISAQNLDSDQGAFLLQLAPLDLNATVPYRQVARLGEALSPLSISGDGSTTVLGLPTNSDSRAGVFPAVLEDSASHNSGAVSIYKLNAAGELALTAFIKAPNSAPGDFFGASVAVSADGSTIGVLAPYERGKAVGIDGDMDWNGAVPNGAVYVYALTAGQYQLKHYLKPIAGGSLQGPLAISHDGKNVAAGQQVFWLGTEPSQSFCAAPREALTILPVMFSIAGGRFLFRTGSPTPRHSYWSCTPFTREYSYDGDMAYEFGFPLGFGEWTAESGSPSFSGHIRMWQHPLTGSYRPSTLAWRNADGPVLANVDGTELWLVPETGISTPLTLEPPLTTGVSDGVEYTLAPIATSKDFGVLAFRCAADWVTTVGPRAAAICVYAR